MSPKGLWMNFELICYYKNKVPAHSSLQIQENRQKSNRCATLADIFHDSKTRGWWSSWTTIFLKQYSNKIKICLCDKNWPFLNVIQSNFKYILVNAFKISSSPYVRRIGRQQCKVRILEGYIFEKFCFIFTTWKLWDELVVSVQWTIYHVRIEMQQSLLSFNMCWNFQKYPRTSDRNKTGRLVKFVDLCIK